MAMDNHKQLSIIQKAGGRINLPGSSATINKKGCLKRAPFFIYWDYVNLASPSSASLRFFCSSRRAEEDFSLMSSTKLNKPEKRRPEKTTPPCLSARYTSLKGSTKQGAVQTFSGLLSRIIKD